MKYNYSISLYFIKNDSIKNTMKDQTITIARPLIIETKKVVLGQSNFNLGEIIQIKNILIDISNLEYFISYLVLHLLHSITDLFTDFNLDEKLNVLLHLGQDIIPFLLLNF